MVHVGSSGLVQVPLIVDMIDRATFAEPAQFSEGIVHVLVNGTFVVQDEMVLEGVFPGVGIRRSGTLVQ